MSAVYPQQAEEMFVKIVSLLGMSASTTSETKERGIYLKVKTEEPGRLIGRKGQTLQSIQYLLNVMVQRGDSDFPRVFIDIADDGRPRPPRRERNEGEKNGERRERRERQPRRERNDEDRPRRDRNDDRRDNRSEEKPETAASADIAPSTLEDTVSAPDKAAAIAQAATKAHQEQAPEQSEQRDERPRREERAPREERQRRPSEMSPADRARRQTLDAVKEVRRWGDAVKLPPLDVEMRKVVLEVLAEHADVTMEGGLDEHVERKRVTLVLAEG